MSPKKTFPLAQHQAAIQSLRAADPILGAAMADVGELEPHQPRDDHFAALLRIIAGQQLSTKVAGAIWKRIETHFAENLAPETILQTETEVLRALGLSGAKVRSFHDLAAHIADGRLKIAELEALPETEIRREIVQVKGLGPWSADMFLMFQLARPDILPVGDLGIRVAVQKIYQLEERPEADELTQIAEKWRPHRTLACRYLWKWLDLPPVAR